MAMHTWFECRIRYEKVMENGMQKKVTEPYLVDALSFTEAEARIIEEMTPFISGEFTVSDIKRINYSELFPSDDEADDIWFKCKLSFITLDEKSGAEKRTSTNVLVQASDLGRAKKNLDAGMKGTMAEYQVSSVTETAIDFRTLGNQKCLLVCYIAERSMEVSAIQPGLNNLATDKHICHTENRCHQKHCQHNAENGHSTLLSVDFCGYGNKIKITLHLLSLPNP